MSQKIQHNQGCIRDNAQHALVRSNIFRPKVQVKQKGKGSFKRHTKHKNRCDFSTHNGFLLLAIENLFSSFLLGTTQ